MRKILMAIGIVFGILLIHADDVQPDIAKLNQFKEFTLSQGQVYTLKVKKGNGVTTVTFPSAIAKIAGVNVSVDGKSDFQISAKPGSYYFNLLALKDGATGTLTVVFNRNTYILYLVQDDTEAYAAVNFSNGSGSSSRATGGKTVTPARLMSLIDMTKTYDLLQQKYPHELRDTTRSANHAIFHYDRFRIELLEVVRFNREDTLVFKLLLHNETEEEIEYDRFSFSAQLKGQTYYMSAADASGVMPPKSSSWAFFTITGTPDGQRNNFAPDNQFKIGLTAKYMMAQSVEDIDSALATERQEPAIVQSEATPELDSLFGQLERMNHLIPASATPENAPARPEQAEQALNDLLRAAGGGGK